MASCDDYQRMGKPIPADEMPLQAQVVIEPFDKWALDFVGPTNFSYVQKEEVCYGMYGLCNQMGRG